MQPESKAKRRRYGRLALAWEYGGPAERQMVLALVASYVLLVAPFVVEVAFFLRQWSPDEVNQTALSFFPAAIAWPAYKTPIYESMFTPSCYRATLVRRDLTPAARRYVTEYARFKETFGSHGQFPGGRRLGASFLAVYISTYLASFVYAAVAFPKLGTLTALPFAAFVVILAVVCWYYSIRRQRALLSLAEAQGFRLVGLRRELAEERRRVG